MIQTTNKPTKVTRKTAIAIDHILTNHVDVKFQTVIFKTDISGYLPVCITITSKGNFFPNKQNKTKG